MEAVARLISGWENAYSAALFTVGKKPKNANALPPIEWRHRICIAEHSPLREVVFRIECYDMPRRAMTHLVRHHEGLEKYVLTSRPDRNKDAKEDVVDVAFTINAQALISISRVRLCNKAWVETIACWRIILNAVRRVDDVVPSHCLPNCHYRGMCPEFPSCGYFDTDLYKKKQDNVIQINKKWLTVSEKLF